jgi:hypothetical protein
MMPPYSSSRYSPPSHEQHEHQVAGEHVERQTQAERDGRTMTFDRNSIGASTM